MSNNTPIESEMRLYLNTDRYKGVSPEQKHKFRIMYAGVILTALVAQVLNILTDKSIPILGVIGWLVLPIVLFTVLLMSAYQNILNHASYIATNNTHIHVVHPSFDCTAPYSEISYFVKIDSCTVTLHYEPEVNTGTEDGSATLYFHNETDCLAFMETLEHHNIKSTM